MWCAIVTNLVGFYTWKADMYAYCVPGLDIDVLRSGKSRHAPYTAREGSHDKICLLIVSSRCYTHIWFAKSTPSISLSMSRWKVRQAQVLHLHLPSSRYLIYLSYARFLFYTLAQKHMFYSTYLILNIFLKQMSKVLGSRLINQVLGLVSQMIHSLPELGG